MPDIAEVARRNRRWIAADTMKHDNFRRAIVSGRGDGFDDFLIASHAGRDNHRLSRQCHLGNQR